MSDRKLATIRKIDSIDPIEGADAIEVATVGGWKVVVKKGEYSVDDLAVYLEIDSWVPTALAPFLTKAGNSPKVFEGVEGERLRTIKLRGQLSQGLLLPYLVLEVEYEGNTGIGDWREGDDVTEALGILKWEKPIPAQLAGQVRGNFPSLVPKTDQERVQNLVKEFNNEFQEDTWSVTEKLDGSSCTMYLDDEDVFHVCSRNLDLKEDENNSFWKVARKYDVEGIMRRNSMKGMAIQGEMIGEGIQGNQYKVVLDFYVYDMYNTHTGQYILPVQLKAACERIGLKHVPILAESITLVGSSVSSVLADAEGKSQLNGSEREGIVFKSNSVHNRSFKAISNKWLLKTGE
jgi:RNA ligase (TIGR02306 family)